MYLSKEWNDSDDGIISPICIYTKVTFILIYCLSQSSSYLLIKILLNFAISIFFNLARTYSHRIIFWHERPKHRLEVAASRREDGLVRWYRYTVQY